MSARPLSAGASSKHQKSGRREPPVVASAHRLPRGSYRATVRSQRSREQPKRATPSSASDGRVGKIGTKRDRRGRRSWKRSRGQGVFHERRAYNKYPVQRETAASAKSNMPRARRCCSICSCCAAMLSMRRSSARAGDAASSTASRCIAFSTRARRSLSPSLRRPALIKASIRRNSFASIPARRPGLQAIAWHRWRGWCQFRPAAL